MIQTTYTSGSGCVIATGTSSATTGNKFSIMFSGCCGGRNGVVGVDAANIYYFPTSSGKAINDGLWHPILVTYDGSTIAIYVDGILDNTATTWNSGSVISSTLYTIGNTGNYLDKDVGAGYRWIGFLKNVFACDYVVTISYVLANSYQLAGSIIYNSGKYNTVILFLTYL